MHAHVELSSCNRNERFRKSNTEENLQSKALVNKCVLRYILKVNSLCVVREKVLHRKTILSEGWITTVIVVESAFAKLFVMEL